MFTDSETYQVPHLRDLCTLLNNIYYGLPLDSTGKIYRRIVINLPPRHWKTRTLVHFCAWSLGKNTENKVIAGSYNETESSDYGKNVRNEINEVENNPDDIVFRHVFPGVNLKQDDRAKGKWALDGQHFSFLSTSPGGSLTGKGGNIKILDDLVKSDKEAMNENHLDGVYTWIVSTWASRTEGSDGGIPIEIICATRWSRNDPTGRVLEDEPGEWYQFTADAYDEETGKMLCDSMLTFEGYERVKNLARRNKNPVSWALFQANYHQKIVAIEGCLYTNIKTYDELPEERYWEAKKAYVDVADQGDDYLCAGLYIVSGSLAYLIDVEYSQANAEVTEPDLAEKIKENGIKEADFESNAGGRSYARNIERLLKDMNYDCLVTAFHQSANKEARILTQSNNVIESVLVPYNWKHLWPEFANHVLNFNVKIKNQPDDCADTVTGIYERMNRSISWG